MNDALEKSGVPSRIEPDTSLYESLKPVMQLLACVALPAAAEVFLEKNLQAPKKAATKAAKAGTGQALEVQSDAWQLLQGIGECCHAGRQQQRQCFHVLIAGSMTCNVCGHHSRLH